MQLGVGISLLMVGLSAGAVKAWGQLPPSPGAPPVSTAPAPPDEKPIATFKQDVILVDLYFTVKDSHGNLVSDLNERNCSVLDDKVPQTLKSFVAEANQPLNLGILLDTSVSQMPWLPMEQDAGSQFIRQVLRAKDQAFLLSFDADVDLLQDYTNSPGLLMHALNEAQINGGNGAITMTNAGPIPLGKPTINWRPQVNPGPIPLSNPRGTLLFDAISFAANGKMNQETGRKAMIILTDGEDQGSSVTSQDAVAVAERNNIPVYVVWVGLPACFMPPSQRSQLPAPPPGQPSPPAAPSQRMLDDRAAECDATHYFTPCPGYNVAQCLSEHTGGRISVAHNSKQLEHSFQQIQNELRLQYAVSYSPSDIEAGGRFHRVEVRCNGESGQALKVNVRKGYYAPKSGR